MSKAVKGFSPEAYLKYVEGGNPRRTPLTGKIAIYGWKLVRVREQKKTRTELNRSGDVPFLSSRSPGIPRSTKVIPSAQTGLLTPPPY